MKNGAGSLLCELLIVYTDLCGHIIKLFSGGVINSINRVYLYQANELLTKMIQIGDKKRLLENKIDEALLKCLSRNIGSLSPDDLVILLRENRLRLSNLISRSSIEKDNPEAKKMVDFFLNWKIAIEDFCNGIRRG